MKRVLSSSAFAIAFVLASVSPALAQDDAEGEALAPAAEPPSASPGKPSPAPLEPDPAVGTVAAPSPDRTPAEGPARYDLVRINVGLRVGHQPAALAGDAPSRGFDTFASNDVLTQFSIDSTIPIVTRGRVVLGAGLGWDVGGRSATVRGLESSLTAHRLYVPIEGRYHFGPGLFVFGKVAPGAVAALASVKDSSSPNELSGTAWAFAADASIGGSILLGPRKHMHKRTVRIWLTPEIGYAYTTTTPIRVGPDRAESEVLGSDERTQLGRLALSGIFWRASVGTTF